MRRGLVVVNPAAGAVSDDLVERVRACTADGLDHVEVVRTERPGEGAAALLDAIRDAPLDVLVVVGGDGTVRELAEALATLDDGPALAIVPAGRGNSAYLELWGDRPWTEVVSAAARGDSPPLRQLDLVRVVETGRASLLGVNAGLLAQIVKYAADDTDGGSGIERYNAAAGRVLQELRSFDARVTVDGAVLYTGQAAQITVGGVRRFGAGGLQLLPNSRLDDGLLDVCVIGRITHADLGDLVALAPSGGHLERSYVEYAQGRSITIERLDGEPLDVEHDGDAFDVGSALTLDVLSSAVATLAPPA